MESLTNSIDSFAKKTAHMDPKQLRRSFSRDRLEEMYDEVGQLSQLNGDVEGNHRGDLRDKIVDALADEWQKDDEDQRMYDLTSGAIRSINGQVAGG